MPFLRVPSREMLLFLGVGAAGYVTDVLAFNWLRDQSALGAAAPMVAKVGAVAVAMVVTYVGNRALTWRDLASANRHREVALFAVFNVVGLLFSVLALHVSHDLMGLTGRMADNISGNVVGVGLGTVFRFWAYRRFVFVGGEGGDAAVIAGPTDPVDRAARPRAATPATHRR